MTKNVVISLNDEVLAKAVAKHIQVMSGVCKKQTYIEPNDGKGYGKACPFSVKVDSFPSAYSPQFERVQNCANDFVAGWKAMHQIREDEAARNIQWKRVNKAGVIFSKCDHWSIKPAKFWDGESYVQGFGLSEASNSAEHFKSLDDAKARPLAIVEERISNRINL